MATPPADFDLYARDYYSGKLAEALNYLEQKTLLPFLERYVLRIVWAFELRHVDFGETAQDDPGRHIILKFVHEARALVGAFKEGSVYGAFHHGRTLVELAAVTHYLFGDSNKTSRRMQRWKDYRRLYHYVHRRKLELLLDAGTLTQEEFDRRCMVGPVATQVDDDVLKGWARLYDAPKGDVLKVVRWHPPFANLIAALAADSRFQADFIKAYDQFSHATHLSPLSAGFVGGWKLVALDPDHITHTVVTALAVANVVLSLLPDVGSRVRSLVAEEENAFEHAIVAGSLQQE